MNCRDSHCNAPVNNSRPAITGFRLIASKVACWAGTQWAFILAVAFIGVWLACGPYFNYSNTWQLVVNTATTVITFLMVFLIQSTQNRDSKAIHLKLDELIRAEQKARNSLIDLEHRSDQELENLEEGFSKLATGKGSERIATRNS